MRTGFSPATFRRGIPLRRLGQQINPFPLIQLPYHRLVNPWTLGAVLHEVSHNLHNELGLAQVIPRNIARRLLRAGCGRFAASVWTRWNRELFADLCGLLLGGPATVGSLMDIVGRSPTTTLTFVPGAVHPTPYLRPFLSIELLRRMGFQRGRAVSAPWTRLYPHPRAGNIRCLPEHLRKPMRWWWTPSASSPIPARQKSLAQVIRFEPKEQQMIEEAARRLSSGMDPGVVPERFLIGAARFALDHRLARPGVITKNFYRELARR
jgi:hypothetical protein